MKTIIIDGQNPMWNKDRNFVEITFKHLLEYCKDTIKYRGYIYLNQIYEALGTPWNPDDENVCYKNDDKPIEFDFEMIGSDVYCVHII